MAKRSGKRKLSEEGKLYFAKHIRMLRAITGLSQRNFAKKFGIPIRNVENWESTNTSGFPPIYAIHLLEKIISHEYNVPIERAEWSEE